MQTGMDDPTVMSLLEFYAQVSLGDCRRETAIHVSKKERKKHGKEGLCLDWSKR